MMTEYYCRRRNGVVSCHVTTSSPRMGSPSTRELVNIGLHSPDGFEMGYAGSGPSDLALTILCDYLGVEPDAESFRGEQTPAMRLAWDLHPILKSKYIVEHPNLVVITGDQIDELVESEGLSHPDAEESTSG